jgi:diguanylate cyclase (GGDEF)-like protein
MVELAMNDTLTGLPNRRRFNEHLPVALARAKRAQRGTALLFLDIDHFKSINDTHGHASGDEVLKAFARRLQRAVRRTDFVAA